MPNQKNTNIVADLTEKIGRAKSVVLTDYRGLTHKQSEELHKAVKKAGGEFVIAKNSLLKISGGYKDLTGPTGALLAYEDELAPLKELFKTVKTLGLPKVKLGFIGSHQYSDTEIEAIAKLPGQDTLRAQVVGTLSSPLQGLVYSLNYNVQKLVYVLGQIKK